MLSIMFINSPTPQLLLKYQRRATSKTRSCDMLNPSQGAKLPKVERQAPGSRGPSFSNLLFFFLTICNLCLPVKTRKQAIINCLSYISILQQISKPRNTFHNLQKHISPYSKLFDVAQNVSIDNPNIVCLSKKKLESQSQTNIFSNQCLSIPSSLEMIWIFNEYLLFSLTQHELYFTYIYLNTCF